MKAHLTRRYLFSASHRLHSAEMSAEENRVTYGKMQQSTRTRTQLFPGSHLQRTGRPKHGMVCNLVDLTALSERSAFRYDLENLNTLKEFSQTVPTTENPLCRDL